MLTIGSLCSGACDGLSLGLEWAGLGPTIWQVEIADDRRENLARHWPNAKRFADVRELTGDDLEPVDIIVCSSPCQDLSSAGARAGLDGPKSRVWWECQRVIGEVRPRWVVVENVASGANRWVPHVRAGLDGLGYSTLPIPIAASNVGAPHVRKRVFVLAHLDGGTQSLITKHGEVGRTPSAVGVGDDAYTVSEQLREQRGGWIGENGKGAAQPSVSRAHSGWPTKFEVVPPVHGVSGRVVRWLGDSVVPQCSEVVGYIIQELENS